MSFLSNITPPHRRGEKNFDRGRAAEGRRDFTKALEYFQAGADGFDAHFAKSKEQGKTIRPSHLIMAGICYTRLGRNEDALAVIGECLEQKEIPDGYLHAGYAAAKLGDAGRTINYWKAYPAWADQRIIATALKEQETAIKEQGEAALQSACEAVAEAVFQQDRANAKAKHFTRGKQKVPPKRGY